MTNFLILLAFALLAVCVGLCLGYLLCGLQDAGLKSSNRKSQREVD